MNIAEIEMQLAELVSAPFDRSEFPFRLLDIYNAPKASLTKLRNGSRNKGEQAGDVLWARKLYFRVAPEGQAAATLDALKESKASKAQAYKASLETFHLGWLVPVAAAFLAIGALGQIVTWVGGPSRALLQTAENGELPPWCSQTNIHGAPKIILIIQAIIVSVLGAFYLVFPNPSAAFYLLSAMTVALYLVMYLLMYAAAIKLRYSHPEEPRHFRVPGGNLGMWLIAGGGFLAVTFALVVSFFPPSQIPVGSPTLYTGMVIIGLIVFGGAPFALHAFKNQSWANASRPEGSSPVRPRAKAA